MEDLDAADKRQIAIIDDDASIRRSLARMLKGTGVEARAFASAQEFLAASSLESIACVVSDLRMPGINGLELQRILHERLPHLSMVFITGHGNVTASVAAMKSGAVDFLEKPANSAALLEAIKQAIDRSRSLITSSNEIETLKARQRRLTVRENQVFGLVAAGLLNKQIAAELGTSEKTIKQHRGRVMTKMEADSFAELVLMAERLGVRAADIDFAKARGLQSAR
ncbi:MAG TPA: response regulator [Candidatus Binataceae bacterium]|nr:response regulator [Candidatus Binataceae bacterium]